MFFHKNIIAFSDCCAYGDTFYAQIFLKKTCPSSRNKPNRKQDLFRHKLNGIQGGRFMDLNRRQILCGLGGIACGAASAYALFWGRKERDAMVDELFHWYSTTNLPIYNPADAKVSLDKTKPTIAESQLCHISVSRWCAANGIGEKSKERSERCARLTADTAGRACEIFNAKIEKGKDWKGTYVAPESVKKCADECHKKPGSGSDWAKGHMDCKPCHDGGKALQNHYVNHP